MSKGVSGALALILMWVAFASFFVAFHPGGITDTMFVSTDNPSGYAHNPVDVIVWLVKRAAEGFSNTSSTTSATSASASAPTSTGGVTAV